MHGVPKVAIVYLSYHSEEYFPDVFRAWSALSYPRNRLACVIVDNPHPVHGSSLAAIEDKRNEYAGKMPELAVLPQKENLGFAGGNNAGMQWAIDHGYDYVFLHNGDGYMDARCLEPLVTAMEQDTTIGAAQSLVMLHPETHLINAAGNSYHYLGFGFCNEYRTPLRDFRAPSVSDISYVSGAAVFLRTELLRNYGLWDKDFFLYHEDIEYTFRLRIAGYRSVLVRESLFFHKYQFGRSAEKFYWMERNRFGVLLMFFRLPTLLVLFPMLIAMEVGLWFFALRGGWSKERMKVYQYWSTRDHWKLWLAKRRYIQSIRKQSDRAMLSYASPTIRFQEAAVSSPALAYVGNPVMLGYYWVIVRGIIWW